MQWLLTRIAGEGSLGGTLAMGDVRVALGVFKRLGEPSSMPALDVASQPRPILMR